jgi:hypothetical protein
MLHIIAVEYNGKCDSDSCSSEVPASVSVIFVMKVKRRKHESLDREHIRSKENCRQ